ncbi:MAG TPA: DUF3422 domain-containing protein [Thermohalobaculum sp.]|nr:DUF3422 domain-containing protein [Thermohalobaculum sp.]
MIEGVLTDHALRYPLTNELHARPFAALSAPGRAVFLAIMPPEAAAERDAAADRAHLAGFVDRHGGAHPAPDASHHSADFGRFRLKWERHTEFVSYTLYEEGPAEALFQAALVRKFPEEWLAAAPGQAIAAIQVEVIAAESLERAEALLDQRLMPELSGESLTCARVIDGNALALGDFRIHEGGFTRFAVIVHGPAGPRRIGRVVQRLIEVETYRTLAMLTLPQARETGRRLNEIERALTALTAEVASAEGARSEQAALDRLTELSAALEALSAAAAFRFGAGRAYEAIVHQRIEMMREERLAGRQMFSEFMIRRFDPAMRTCHATERRLGELATRASRIAELLRTRVNVAVEAQNQELLETMNRRAAMQLRLQETVEGLSVVAISYYAVSLASYLLAPLAKPAGIDKTAVTAAAVIPVVGLVWWSIRRMRRRLGGPGE